MSVVKSCNTCIHICVCRTQPNVVEDCSNYACEFPAIHTLRIVYAELIAFSAKCRNDAQVSSELGRPANAMCRRENASVLERAATRVRHLCLKIGFDPKKDLEVK